MCSLNATFFFKSTLFTNTYLIMKEWVEYSSYRQKENKHLLFKLDHESATSLNLSHFKHNFLNHNGWDKNLRLIRNNKLDLNKSFIKTITVTFIFRFLNGTKTSFLS